MEPAANPANRAKLTPEIIKKLDELAAQIKLQDENLRNVAATIGRMLEAYGETGNHPEYNAPSLYAALERAHIAHGQTKAGFKRACREFGYTPEPSLFTRATVRERQARRLSPAARMLIDAAKEGR